MVGFHLMGSDPNGLASSGFGVSLGTNPSKENLRNLLGTLGKINMKYRIITIHDAIKKII